MNAAICTVPPENLEAIRSYRIRGVVAAAGSREIVRCPAGETGDGAALQVVLVDYGLKRNIIRSLQKRGCDVTVVPHDTPAEEILALRPDGIMLSNGPGDPEENVYEIAQIRALIGRVPLFGICLGHQLTALAAGGKTEKMKFGHRGANQPVRDLQTGRTWITSQNHGYAVVSDSLPTGAVRFVNANDGSCEGIDYPALRAFTTQFHPEACAGPRDTGFLFDRFCAMMDENREGKNHAEG